MRKVITRPSAKVSAEKAVIKSAAYKNPGAVQNGTHVSNASSGTVPAPFVFSYTAVGAAVLRIGDPTGWLSLAYGATVAPTTISFGYTDAMYVAWLQSRTLSFSQIDYEVTLSTTQFNNQFRHIGGYAQETDPVDLSSYIIQAKNPNALDPNLLKVRFDRSFSMGAEGALFLNVNALETVNLTIYWDAIA